MVMLIKGQTLTENSALSQIIGDFGFPDNVQCDLVLKGRLMWEFGNETENPHF